jgi:hypothetical protein
MLPEHRRVMHEIRRTTERTLAQHREILRRERAAAAQPVRDHRRALEAARLQAREYKKEWAEAKRDGARLLRFLERFRIVKRPAA